MATKLPVDYAHWDDMVFEDREKSYGAYELRQRYPRHLLIGLVSVTVLGASLIAFPRWRHLFFTSPIELISNTIIYEAPIPPPILEQEKPELPKLPPPEPPKLRTIGFPIPEPSSDPDLEKETIHAIDTLKNAPNLGFEDLEGEDRTANLFEEIGNGEDIPDVVREQGEPNISIFIVPDEEPVPLNMNEITRLIEYPSIAREAGIEGTIVARVLVGRDGKYMRHKIINGAHPLLEREVEKHLSKLKFTPAIQGRKPILFWVNIPFTFRTLD